MHERDISKLTSLKHMIFDTKDLNLYNELVKDINRYNNMVTELIENLMYGYVIKFNTIKYYSQKEIVIDMKYKLHHCIINNLEEEYIGKSGLI